MNKLNIAVMGDLHLGHTKNPTIDIIKNIKNAFPNDAETSELDIIFIEGDIFDNLLSLPDEDVIEIDLWIAYMLNLCAKYDILLRVLEGTPSHDWKQSERFLTIAQVLDIPVDLKYIKDIHIEYIERFNINVLYIPDEINNTTDKTLIEVKELLQAKGLSQVEYAVMHGIFDYQHTWGNPNSSNVHSSSEYLKIVKELIFIGHIHTFSTFDRIIATGSIDRISHGEEHPKGHTRINVLDNEKTITFIENKNAKTFKSIDCTGLTIDETFIKVDKEVKELPDCSNIRIIGNKDNPIFSNINQLIARYPLLLWSKLIKESDKEDIISETLEYEYIPITITKDNIKSLLLDRININTNPDTILTAEIILEEILNG